MWCTWAREPEIVPIRVLVRHVEHLCRPEAVFVLLMETSMVWGKLKIYVLFIVLTQCHASSAYIPDVAAYTLDDAQNDDYNLQLFSMRRQTLMMPTAHIHTQIDSHPWYYHITSFTRRIVINMRAFDVKLSCVWVKTHAHHLVRNEPIRTSHMGLRIHFVVFKRCALLRSYSCCVRCVRLCHLLWVFFRRKRHVDADWS